MTKVHKDTSSNPPERQTTTPAPVRPTGISLIATYAQRMLTEEQRNLLFVSREEPSWEFYLVPSDESHLDPELKVLEKVKRVQTFLTGSFLQAAEKGDEVLRSWVAQRLRLLSRRNPH